MMRRSVQIIVSIFVFIVLVGVFVGLFFLLRSNNEGPKGAVATSTVECTDIAVSILKNGGSAVDSAVAACLCQGLTVPQSSGVGGGMIATVYIKKTGVIESINSREIAPLAAYKDMYPDDASSLIGGKAVAVPGELKGLFELHKRHGKLKWEEVVQPVIELAENGYKVSNYLAMVLEERVDKIKAVPAIRYLLL